MTIEKQKKSPQELYQRVTELEVELSGLSEIISQVRECCEAKTLISERLAEELQTRVGTYQKNAWLLHRYCEEKGLEENASLALVGECLRKEIELCDVQRWIQETEPFYQLTCTLEQVEEELKQEKENLKHIMQQTDSEWLKKAIVPYWAVVKNVNQEMVDDEADDAMDEHFTKPFCRAVYRRQLFFEKATESDSFDKVRSKEKQISDMAESEGVDTQPPIENSDSISAETIPDSQNEPLLENNLIESAGTLQSNTILEHFCGFVDEWSVEFEGKKQGKLQTKKFLSEVVGRNNGKALLFALARTAHRKVLFPERETIPKLQEHIQYLFQKGYLEKVVYRQNDIVMDTGYCLSQSGWESFSCKDTTIAEYKRCGYIPKYLKPVSKSEITMICAAQARHLYRISMCFPEVEDKYSICTVIAEHKNAIIYIIPKGNSEDSTIMVISGLCEKQSFSKWIEHLRKLIQDTPDSVAIAVSAKEDITVLSSRLALPSELDNRTYYVIESEHGIEWYDGNEQEKWPDFLKESMKQSIDENVPVAEEPESIVQEECVVTVHDTPERLTEISHREESELFPAKSEAVPSIKKNEKKASIPKREVENVVQNTEQAELYRQAALSMFEKKQYPQGLTLMRALGRYGKEYTELYRRFAAAMDDPAAHINYKYSELQMIYPESFGSDEGYDALALSGFLRLFFSEEARWEPYYIQNMMSALENNLVFDRIPELKDLLYIFGESFRTINRGFDQAIVNAMSSSENHMARIESCRKQAIALLDSKLEVTNVENLRVKETRRSLFGADSIFYKILIDIRDNKIGQAGVIREALKRFLRNPDEELAAVYSRDEILISEVEAVAEEAWDALAHRFAHQRRDTLKGSPKGNIVNRLIDIICVAMSWITMSQEQSVRQATDYEVNLLRPFRDRLIEQGRKCLEVLDSVRVQGKDELAAHYAALRYATNDLMDRLENGYDATGRKYFYIRYLKESRLEVTSDYIPCLESEFLESAPFHLCKRIVKDSQEQDKSWETVIQRIFESQENGCDFGHAQLIKDYLSICKTDFVWPENYDIQVSAENVRAKVESKSAEFGARLEMAENYGWVEDTARIDEIVADMENRKRHYMETGNYGFYFRTMDAYMKILQQDAESHRDTYVDRLTSLRNTAGKEWPIFREIERLIDEQMYIVAQDYMDQVEKEGRREVPESTSLVNGNEVLTRFIANYAILLKRARDATSSKLSSIFMSSHRGEHNNLVSSGQDMLDNWPRSAGSAQSMAEKLEKMFFNMGLPVKKVLPKMAGITGSTHQFTVTFEQSETTADYPHPIGAFGSEMIKKSLNVFVLFGNKSEVTMNTEIRRTMTTAVAGATLFIADTPMALSDRRKLAQKIKTENKNLHPYLIMDRVMILHLANQPKTERWHVFLKCALPFHYYNPYTESNLVDICPEMFIGRRGELEQVVNAGGANIIYGGRQLGKTALLHRARKLEDNRDNGKWAVYIDIKHETAESAAQRIYEELQDEGFLEFDEGSIDWPTLARKITRQIKNANSKVEKVLLLLDEADHFLVDAERMDYLPIDCLKRIQTDSENRFKFVLAGLHNVMRFHERASESNSTLPQLGTITIKPLPFKEASELLERPLSYLGFKLHEKDIRLIAQILSSTNYYPGLIQFYASRLVSSICQNYGNANEKPPYYLEEDQILNLLKEPEFTANIREKFMITLGIDQNEKGYYRTLAHVLAYCYFRYANTSGSGFTAQELYTVCGSFDIYSITQLTMDQLRVLLDELIELNVLRKNVKENETRYIFNRASFRHMLGDEDRVESVLLEIMEKEQMSYVRS